MQTIIRSVHDVAEMKFRALDYQDSGENPLYGVNSMEMVIAFVDWLFGESEDEPVPDPDEEDR
jgi:hypothetical protein